MIDASDDATQTLLEIEEVCLRSVYCRRDDDVEKVLRIIWAWKQRPDEEEEVAA